MLDLQKAGLSILLVEQNLYSALAASDRLYVLDTGKIVHESPTSELAKEPERLFGYLGVN